MELHETQEKVAKSRAKYRVVNCGRQWGKTTLAVWEMIACAATRKDRRIGYIAPTYIQARDIAWKMLKDYSEPIWAKEPNETRLEIYLKTQDGGESEIVLKGWESIESVRGTQFDFVVLDEVAKMRNFKEGYEAALQGALVKRDADVLFISTPYGYNHFYDLHERNGDKWESFTFTSYDNPFLTKDVLDQVKSTTTPDYFAQEYLAQFTRFTGLIYREFDATRHIHTFTHELNEHADYYFGLDFAVRGYTAVVPIKVKSDGNIYILDEYKVESKTAQQHIESIKEMLKKYADLDKWMGYGDPAGFMKNQQKGDMIWAIADEYLESGLSVTPANNEVTGGINFVRQLFLQNRLHISPSCTALYDEIQQYQWKDTPDSQKGVRSDPEEVRKINDHLVDALRYVCYSKPTAPEEIEPKRDTVFPIKFPPPRIEEPNQNEDRFEEIDTTSIFDA